MNFQDFYLIEGLYGKSKILSPDDILNYIQDKHHRKEDFDDGDIVDRIYEYDRYILKEMPIDIFRDEWEININNVDNIIKQIKRDNKYDPIVVGHVYGNDYTIIDGTHRLEALKKLGYKNILVYIGEEL